MRAFYCLIILSVSIFADDKLKNFCKGKVESADSHRAVEGKDEWLFPFKEIQHLAKKDQYSQNAFGAIVDYNKALSAQGIGLMLIPLPPKALIYKEKLTDKESDWNPYKVFHEKLKEQGVKTLDLVPLFYKTKVTSSFCKRDSHFSPNMAKIIAEQIFLKSGFQKEDQKFAQEKQTVSFEGDLVRQSKSTFKQETFEIEYLTKNKNFIEPDAKSPLILLGDSNCLVYSSGGDMHTRGAGIFDYLNKSFGQSVDLLGVKGSGIDTARIDFFRRSMDINYLKKKKLVIWLFAAYELTESRGWKKIPVRR